MGTNFISGAESGPKQNSEPFIVKLADKIALSSHVKMIYGDLVERDEVTIIPVGKVVWGAGGGEGGDTNSRGLGGGGGTTVTPIGYIEIKAGSTRFKPIFDPALIVQIIAASGLIALLLANSARRIIQAARRK